ncbi:hypothetical protein AAG570_003872 [Ranatra chinensis]|uniref:Sorbitol dehydrogenase n=1 Tax=Ranatra chinensis TaxID=642074 RepID=A0ABD0Y251_9HEMI
MQCVGICGSDVHYYERGRIGDFVLRAPMVIGHEASGIVAKIGSKVTNLKIGDRVAIEPGVSCRKCSWCKGGRYNLCPAMQFCATPPVDGNLATYYTHSPDFCHKLPDDVSMEEGAMLEPLSVGVHACRRGRVEFGSLVLVLGAGPIGLVTLMAAKAMGAKRVIVCDPQEHRLKIALDCGADEAVCISSNSAEKTVDAIKTLLHGSLPDVTLDCAGFQTTAQIGIQATRPGGVYVLVGMGQDSVDVPLVLAAIKEVDIRGVFRYANDYPLALEMVASKRVDLSPLLTHKFDIEETQLAFQTAMNPDERSIKVMIYCNRQNNEQTV